MALYGSKRDAKLVKSINRELINDYIDMEVGIYILSLDDTKANIYDESDTKVYQPVIRINALIGKDDKVFDSTEIYDQNRTATFGFIRDDLVNENIVLKEGDVIEFDNEFYEIDTVGSSQYWAGKNPSTDLGFTLNDRKEFGLSVAVNVTAHLTRRNRLNIQEVRAGQNKSNVIPKNL